MKTETYAMEASHFLVRSITFATQQLRLGGQESFSMLAKEEALKLNKTAIMFLSGGAKWRAANV
jgi:hypothetical protein